MNKVCNFVHVLLFILLIMNSNLITLLLLIFFFSFEISHSQNEEIIKKDASFDVVDEVPIFPGCESLTSNAEKRKCMQKKLAKHVSKKFNINVIESKCVESKMVDEKEVCIKSEYWPGFSSGTARIYTRFTIDKEGNVGNIKIRAPHEKLKEEAEKVVKTIPQMTPAMSKGKKVSLDYMLPIVFRLSD